MKRIFFAALFSAGLGLFAADGLEKSFATPPASAGAHVWWHWNNGNISKEGLKADLDSMKKVGIAGVQIFDVGMGAPKGPVDFMSPEWMELFTYAVSEADKLGLEVCVHNCPGWSSSGGPWMKVEDSMKIVSVSETVVKGPQKFSGILKQPETARNFYRDIKVFAFKTPEFIEMQDVKFKLASNLPEADAAKLIDCNTKTELSIKQQTSNEFVFSFESPFTATTLVLQTTQKLIWMEGVISVSDDGQNFKEIKKFKVNEQSFPVKGTVDLGGTFTAKFWKFNMALPKVPWTTLAATRLNEIYFSPRMMIDNAVGKSGGTSEYYKAPAPNPALDLLAVKKSEILDLSSKMNADGKLDWELPEGNWTILRVGYTTTGKTNHPARASGYECDKMSRKAFEAHWNGMMAPLLAAAGKYKAFNNALIDSYEVGGQNWTEGFAEEFKKRRGYDIGTYMITLAGWPVESSELSERFLYDYRLTVSELMAENYFGYFAELCRKNGIQSSVEPYGGPFENLLSGGSSDIVMGEFWIGQKASGSVRLAASAAHIYGHKIVGAESFTADGKQGRWLQEPATLKSSGEVQLAQGLNRFILHSYMHQPWMDLKPGITLERFGSHFGRHNTWWDKSREWFDYMARAQYMLQEGQFVADVCIFSGETNPNGAQIHGKLKDAGYDYDVINPDVLLNRLSVENGRLKVKGGISYSMLFIPANKYMTAPVLAKIKSLLESGAVIASSGKVSANPTLSGYPESDKQVKSLADAIWGESFAPGSVRQIGKGKLIAAASAEDAAKTAGLNPDFQALVHKKNGKGDVDWTHRKIGDSEFYFVSNQSGVDIVYDCKFRVSGKQPEIWNPENGSISDAPAYSVKDGITSIPLAFDSSGSYFIIFRRNAKDFDPVLAVSSAKELASSESKIQIVKAVYGADGKQKDVTETLQKAVTGNELNFKVTNDALGGDPAPMVPKSLTVTYIIDGKEKTVTANEFGTLRIAQTSAGIKDILPCSLSIEDGKLYAVFSKNGSVSIDFASGKKLDLACKTVPAPFEIKGSWELKFQPGCGAPEKLTLDKLVSWTELKNDGAKYFSGTATYTKDFELDPAYIPSKDSEVYLNLGEVKNLAQVTLNGKTFPVLWKPPFRLDVSSALKSGKNSLEIQVTNLWVNRMIGDEQLVDDCEGLWVRGDGFGKRLKDFPAWIKEGKPRPSGRYTFTIWKGWEKDEKLLPSGLLSPLRIEVEKTVPVK